MYWYWWYRPVIGGVSANFLLILNPWSAAQLLLFISVVSGCLSPHVSVQGWFLVTFNVLHTILTFNLYSTLYCTVLCRLRNTSILIFNSSSFEWDQPQIWIILMNTYVIQSKKIWHQYLNLYDCIFLQFLNLNCEPSVCLYYEHPNTHISECRGDLGFDW